MSRLFDKFFSKILALIVIVLFIIGFRETILSENHILFTFGELMGLLPFAQMIAEVVTGILKCQYEVPIITTTNVMTDLLRLAMMACIQPLFVGLLTKIFLPLPRRNQILSSSLRNYEINEAYMNSFGYRMKEFLITILSVPILAFLSSWLTEWMFTFFVNTFGQVISTLLGVVSVALLSAVSLVPLLVTGTTLGVAIAWRLLVTLGARMITTFITDAICIAVYIAFLGGMEHQVAISIISLIIWLFIMDLGIGLLQKAIVGKSRF